MCCVKPVSIPCLVTWPIVEVRTSIDSIFRQNGFSYIFELGEVSDAPLRNTSSFRRRNVNGDVIDDHIDPASPV